MTRAFAIGALITTAVWTVQAQRGGEASFFTCGADQILRDPIPVTPENVILAGDGRLFAPCPMRGPRNEADPRLPHPPDHREMRELALLDAASKAPGVELRRRAAQAFGRIASPSFVAAGADGPLVRLLEDTDATVRREAANAIAEAVAGSYGDMNAGFAALLTPDVIAAARRQLEARLARETDNDAAAAILESLGRLNVDDAGKAAIERTLVAALDGDGTRVTGAAKGLEILVRRAPRRVVADATRTRLRALAVDASAPPMARRLVMATLQTLRDDDPTVVARAAGDADWQVRRLAAIRIDFSRPDQAQAGAALAADREFQVRWEIVAPLARDAQRTHDCARLLALTGDPAPIVAMRAIDQMPAGCADAAAVQARLDMLATPLTAAGSGTQWHVPARAWAAIARLAPDAARQRLQGVSVHSVWQVRATAAAVAAVLQDEAVLTRLAADRDPNVRTPALEGLARIKSPHLADAAIAALQSTDYQLVRAAAGHLRGVADDKRDAAVAALLTALRRLTESARDTSRDPRAAIVERLKELLLPARQTIITPYFADFDPKIREAVAGLPGVSPGLLARQRYPHQPPASLLAALPRTATLTMAGGEVVELALMPEQAPVTVANFVALARAGYYDGLTFHRIVPNFVVQGGSPGANEYMGDARYWRDEIGLASNLRGTVGLSTRGRDTGDGQFYVNLVDLPRLDHDYTVFARVSTGMDAIDRMLEGAVIQRVTVR